MTTTSTIEVFAPATRVVVLPFTAEIQMPRVLPMGLWWPRVGSTAFVFQIQAPYKRHQQLDTIL
jgi:hypothetical protein